MEKPVFKLYADIPKLSLRDLSLNKVATLLWNNRELLKVILKCPFKEEVYCELNELQGEEWKTVQVTAKKLIADLSICATLKENLLELLWPATYKMFSWKYTYARTINKEFFQHFYWTEHGRIDNKRTAIYLIGNTNIPIRERFILACSMCLKDEIHEIWDEMSEEDKFYFSMENQEELCPLLLFWADNLKYSCSMSVQYTMGAFEVVNFYELVEAVKYLFSLLIEAKKSDLAKFCFIHLSERVRAASFIKEDGLEIGYFLFSQLNDECRQITCHNHYVLSMALLLHASDHKQFLKVLIKTKESALHYDMEDLLFMIFYMYHLGVKKDCCYRKLLINVWRIMPDAVKRSSEYFSVHCLCMLIRDNFPFILMQGAFEISKLTSPDFKARIAVEHFDCNQEKWEILLFLIKEVVRIRVLKQQKRKCVFLLGITENTRTAWRRFLRFVQKVRYCS